MTQSRSLSEKFPSYRQEACTTENVIQCLSIRERKEGWGDRKNIWVQREKKSRRAHSKNQGRSQKKRGEKSGHINKIKTTIQLTLTKCIGQKTTTNKKKNSLQQAINRLFSVHLKINETDKIPKHLIYTEKPHTIWP